MLDTLFDSPSIVSAPKGVVDDDKFCWSSENRDLIVPRQPATAVYLNNYKQIVIRQEGDWNEDDDPYVVLSVNNVESVIERMRAVAESAS